MNTGALRPTTFIKRSRGPPWCCSAGHTPGCRRSARRAIRTFPGAYARRFACQPRLHTQASAQGTPHHM